jgi:hypothetical protein
MFVRAFAVGFVLVTMVGCRTASDESPPRVSAEPPPAKRAAPLDVAPVENGPTLLGAPCKPGKGDPNQPDACGTKQQVAMLYHPGRAIFTSEVKCKLGEKFQSAMHETRNCITDNQLYAEGRCVACRLMDAGWTVVARLDELTPAQALFIQGRLLGLSADKPLVGEAAWKQALAARGQAHAMADAPHGSF